MLAATTFMSVTMLVPAASALGGSCPHLGYYCGNDRIGSGKKADTLYYCSGTGAEPISHQDCGQCVVGALGEDDHCAPSPTPSPTPSPGACPHLGYYCGNDRIGSGKKADTLYYCSGTGAEPISHQDCGQCVVGALGEDDQCAPAPPAPSPPGSCSPSPHPYPNDCEQASLKAKKYHKNNIAVKVGLCDHYCAFWYGLSSSGWEDATAHWKGTPAKYKLDGWEEGAMALWSGGHGHCAIGAPKDVGRNVFSTDYPTAGLVGHADASTITKAWGKTFRGWYKPYFPNAVHLDGTWANETTNLAHQGLVV